MRLRLIPIVIAVPLLPLAAQVGFLPTQSPYREIQNGIYVEGSYGHLYGGGGSLDVGPKNGATESIRFTVRAKNMLQFSFGGWLGQPVRNVIDANDSVATRNRGLTNEHLVAGEIGVQLNLTGGKTWHHAAPFVGVGFGVVVGQGPPAIDTSGYSFGTKLFFAPMVGTRYFLGQRAYLRLDVRAVGWKLDYPPSYALEPAQQPGTLTHPNAVNPTGMDGEYTLLPEIRFGLGIAW